MGQNLLNQPCPLAFKFVNEFGGLDVPEVERPLLTAQQDLGKCVLN